MITGIIYKYTSPSGKVYIGQTTNELFRRRMWFGKGRYTGGKSKIDRARRKYGPENFKYEVILKNEYSSVETATTDLNRWEIYYIGIYDSYRKGYNSTLGGEGNRGYSLSEETRNLISKLSKGKKKYPGFGAKVSAGLKGIPKSDSHRLKLSKAKTNSGKKIMQFSKEGKLLKIWDNIDQVAKALRVSRESIAGCCRGKAKTAHKYIWKYKTKDYDSKRNNLYGS